MNKFKLSLLTMAMATVGISHFGAYALESDTEAAAEEDSVEVISVRGFRRSLQESQNLKMFNSSFVEAISAEDIGKLPDSSIAESLARMPGLAAQRLDGRASRITIRGFGENESATTFNGREQVSISDNRGVEFDLYPSEIMSQVVVYKTPDARLEAEGIAGVIDLRTVSPLSRDERVVQVNGQYERTSFGKLNPDGNNAGMRGTFAYIDQFADNTLGVAIAATTMKSPNQEKRWNAWGYDGAQQSVEWGAGIDAGDFELSNDFVILGGAKPFARSSTLRRDSILAVVEYLPNDRLKLTADALYVDFSDEKILRGIEVPGVWAGGNTLIREVSDGVVSQGTITNRAVVRNDYEVRDATLKAFGFNANYDLTDYITLDFDISRSTVKRQIWSMENYSGTGRGDGVGATDTIDYVLDPDGTGAIFTPTLDYSDWNLILLGAPLSWGNGVTIPGDAQDGFINTPEIDGDLTTLRLAANHALDNAGPISSLDYGISYKDRSKTKRSEGYYLTLTSYPGALAPVPEQYRLGFTDLSFLGFGNMIAYDSRGLVRDGFYNLTPESLNDPSHLARSWTVNEQVTAIFAQANLDTEIADFALSGNVGLRYVQTKQDSQGFGNYVVDGIVQSVPTDVSHDFNILLPSLNLKLALDDQQSIRFGAAKTMSRPRLDDMNASMSISYNQNATSEAAWSVGGGNPTLEPKTAVGLDLGYENYFHPEGYFAVTVFHKELKDWIFGGSTRFEFDDITAPDGSTPVNKQAIASGQVNGGSGSLSGLELSASIPLSIVHSSLEGFGIFASHTKITSDIQDPNGNDFELPGLSDKIQTFTFYYDKEGFSARVSMRKRSDFKGDIYNIGFETAQVDIDGETIWDAQIGYDFGAAGFTKLDGLSVFLQGQNLSNQPFTTRHGSGAIRDYQDYGRTYLLGFSYQF
ncbi:TonB-dependent receptor [Alkalimonas sp. MEB108]|uniref:TonB-dependent receptor n=1 Tax=Alkalimonas cellulosilytica TaxID=3058395 RepID=A0ABU7J6G0_9GAMM|nr:TonB-dependent receptor [Alkalimonas sp. MEB108]MEE2002091.1 TonB-dependent receptor [Alkalimonas sp. MEB108]